MELNNNLSDQLSNLYLNLKKLNNTSLSNEESIEKILAKYKGLNQQIKTIPLVKEHIQLMTYSEC